MATSDPLFHMGHRGRLRAKFMDGHAMDYEVMELLLTYSIPRRDVRPLARTMLARFNGFDGILSASVDNLRTCPGVGDSVIALIKLVNETNRLALLQKVREEDEIFYNTETIRNYCRMLGRGSVVEEFHVIYLSRHRRFMEEKVHTIGGACYVNIYAEEIVKRAILIDAGFVILMHNHPTPGTSFSEDDMNATKVVQEKLNAAGIGLCDHFVVAGNTLFSGRDQGWLK